MIEFNSQTKYLAGRIVVTGALLAAVATSTAHVGATPPPPRASDGITIPAKSLTSTDDASAILVNPANLAFSAGPEMRFTWIHTGNSSPLNTRGYSLDFGLPFWVFATGLRVDWLRPTESAPPPFAYSNIPNRYNWVRWPLAVRLGDFAALGTTMAWSTADVSALDGHFSVSSGLTVRPSRFVSAAIVARDFNSPQNDVGFEIKPSVDFGLALRPVGGHKMLEIAGEVSYRTGYDLWVPTFSMAADLPYVGRFRAGVQMLDPEAAYVVASAGLEVNMSHLEAAGGAIFGTAPTRTGAGFYASAAVRSFRARPGVPLPSIVARVRLESTPSVRKHTLLLRKLWRAARDDEIEGVLFEFRSAPAASLAHAEELADAIKLLRARGKKVFCHLEDAGGAALYVCSHANRIAINPAGGLRFSGLSARYFYFGGLLDKLGVRADFVRIGRHKLAAEQFTRTGGSDIGRQDHRKLLRAREKVFLAGVSRGRSIDRKTLATRLAKGPFIAPEARDAKLVDMLVYEDEIERFVDASLGRKVLIRDLEFADEEPPYWRQPPKVAVVYLHGDMIDGESIRIPIIGIKLAGSYTIVKALKKAREDPTVKAVVFRIETGGGSSLAADLILREATLVAKEKPLVVSMGSKAASGGYYAAVAAEDIYANRATLTGSIGIFYGKVDIVGLFKKLGIKSEGFRTTPRADAESLFRPFTDDERKVLGKKVKQFYDLFIGRVAQGRKLTPAQVHKIGQGRVWTGWQARRRGLVDRLGGFRQALARARKLAHLPASSPIIELPVQKPSLLEFVLELVGVPVSKGQNELGWVPPPIIELARMLVPLTMYKPYKPLALMELLVTEP